MYITVPIFDSSNASDGSGSPRWWRNFIRENPPGQRFSNDTTNDRLLEYSASYVVVINSEKVCRYVDFYDEQAYTWFLLRWA